MTSFFYIIPTDTKTIGRLILKLALCCLLYTAALADETVQPEDTSVERAQFYISPEERREAGLGTPITDWLTFYGLLEGEYEYTQENYRDGTSFSEDFVTGTIQIGLEAEFTENLFGEFVLDVEHDQKFSTLLDEGVIAWELDSTAILFGIQNLDFGEYYSHFVVGPLLEFGETRKWALTLDQELNENLDIMGYVFDNEGANASGDTGWGATAEWVSEDESIRIGTGVLSDLRQSDEFFLEDYNTSPTKVPGWNLYALFGFDSYEITAEVVTATSYFNFDDEILRPQAYNLEFAYFINYDFQFAGRIEHSKDFKEEPEWRSGLSISWLVGKHLILSVDYLHGTFKDPLFIEEDETYVKYNDMFAAQFGFEF